MSVKLLTEPQLECLSLKGGCRGSSKSTLVKMSNCWKSHAAAQFILSGFRPYLNHPLDYSVHFLLCWSPLVNVVALTPVWPYVYSSRGLCESVASHCLMICRDTVPRQSTYCHSHCLQTYQTSHHCVVHNLAHGLTAKGK